MTRHPLHRPPGHWATHADLGPGTRPAGPAAASRQGALIGLLAGLIASAGVTLAIAGLFATVLADLGTDPRRIPALASAAAGRPVGASLSVGSLRAWLNSDPGTALAALATSLGWLILGWLVLGAIVHTLAVVPGAGFASRRHVLAPVSARMLPQFIRHALDVGLRTAVVVGIAGAASTAVAVTPILAAAQSAAATPGPSLGWPDLDRPTGPAPPAITKEPGIPLQPLSSSSGNRPDPAAPAVVLATPATPASPTSDVAQRPSPSANPDEGRVLVAPGDSLWGIAAGELGADGSAEQIAARWPQWYAANRDLIGPDPNLILPGQWLTRPRPSPSIAGGSS